MRVNLIPSKSLVVKQFYILFYSLFKDNKVLFKFLKKCALFNSKDLVVACYDCVLIDYFYQLQLSIVYDKLIGFFRRVFMQI